jgi:hypothetical protein
LLRDMKGLVERVEGGAGPFPDQASPVRFLPAIRPKGYTDERWLADLADAHRLKYG